MATPYINGQVLHLVIETAQPEQGDSGEREDSDKLYLNTESLSRDLDKERDDRKEERFLWVVIVLILLDAFLLGKMTNWTAPIVIGIVELFGLIVFARHCGVQEVDLWLNKMLTAIKPGTEDGSAEQKESAKKMTDLSNSPIILIPRSIIIDLGGQFHTTPN